MKTNRRPLKKIFRRILSLHLLLFLTAPLAACSPKTPDPVTLDVISLGTRGDQEMKIPRFVYAEGQSGEADQLNSFILELEDRYMAAGAEPDRDMTLQTYVAPSGSDILQATLVSCEVREDYTDYNVYSLVYDNGTGHIITSQEALERSGLTGADLSQKAGRLFLDQMPGIREEKALRSTEVQGFLLNSKGQTTRLFIKFIVRDEEGKDEQYFRAYSPAGGSLIPMHELGFSLP